MSADYSGQYELLRFDGEPASMNLRLKKSSDVEGNQMYYCTILLGKMLRGRVYYTNNKLRGNLVGSRTQNSSRQLKMERIFKAGMEEGYGVTFHERFNLLVLESDGHVWEFEAQEEAE